MTNGHRPLPKGWRWEKISDISRFQHGGTPSKSNNQFWDGSIPWASPKDIRSPRITETIDHISLSGVNQGKATVIEAGTILVVARSGILARTVPITITAVPMAFNQDIKALTVKQDIVEAEFLYWMIRKQEPYILKHGVKKGATVHSLKSNFLEQLYVPLPPLAEQRRIAALLGEQIAAIERARAAAKAQLHAARALTSACLGEIFGSDEAQVWPVMPLGQCGEIVSGVTLGRKTKGKPTRRVSYLRVANVKDGQLDLADVNEIEATEAEIGKLRLRYGDLLLTEGGDPDKLGRGTYWANQLTECIHQNHIYRVRFDLNRFSPEFLAAQIGSRYGKAYFLAHAKQTTGIATINQKVLGAFPLMAPALEVQRQVASRVVDLAKQSDLLREAADAQLAAIANLPQAVLSRALRGATV
jgi:type I restriction enzyme, S subunit